MAGDSQARQFRDGRRDQIAVFYFFSSNLEKHVDIYLSWANVSIQAGFRTRILTLIDFKTLIRQWRKFFIYRRSGVKVMVLPKNLHDYFAAAIFYFASIRFRKVVVHLRKRNPGAVLIAKRMNPGKIKGVSEIEGDPVSESDYLSKNPFRPGFYDHIVRSKEDAQRILRETVRLSDGVIAVSDDLSRLLRISYGAKMVLVQHTGFDSSLFFYDENVRQSFRKFLNVENRVVYLWSGNSFYSWQNLGATVRLFAAIKREARHENPFLLLLCQDLELGIASGFCRKYGVDESESLITSASYKSMNSYLNAADFGIILRDEHQMNKFSSPGKLGEYLGSGLEPIRTSYVGSYSKELNDQDIGIVLDNFKSANLDLSCIPKVVKTHRRREVSSYARRKFSVQALSGPYVEFLENL